MREVIRLSFNKALYLYRHLECYKSSMHAKISIFNSFKNDNIYNICNNNGR